MKKIGIVGAGISGLVLASLLKKNGNYQISIFEKDNLINKNINGIQVSPNATKVLNKINFNIFDKNKFYSLNGINFYDCSSNKKIATMNLNYLQENSYIALNRNDLISFLLKEFSLNENLIQKEVIEIDRQSIKFKDNEKLSFDTLVIADGIFSKLRSKKNKNILYSGYSAFRGFFNTTYQKNHVDLWMGKDFHLVNYPVDKEQNNSFTLIKKMSKIEEISSYGFEIKNFYNDYKNMLPIDAHDIFNTSQVTVWPIYKMKNLYYGDDYNVFIGDSAHGFIPTRAQGAAQAIEDSFELYRMISSNKIFMNNLDQVRKTRINKIIKKSENNLLIFHIFFLPLRVARNLIIKLICTFKILTKITNSYIFDFDIEKKL